MAYSPRRTAASRVEGPRPRDSFGLIGSGLDPLAELGKQPGALGTVGRDDSLIDWADHEPGVHLEVVKRSDDVKGFHVLPRRWVVERTFGWLTRWRRLCRDYERSTAHAEEFIRIGLIRLMAARLAGHRTRYRNIRPAVA